MALFALAMLPVALLALLAAHLATLLAAAFAAFAARLVVPIFAHGRCPTGAYKEPTEGRSALFHKSFRSCVIHLLCALQSLHHWSTTYRMFLTFERGIGFPVEVMRCVSLQFSERLRI